MKRFITTLIVLIASLILANSAAADDVSDVKEAWVKLNAAFNAGDVDIMSQYIHAEASLFNYAGRTLSEGFDKDGLKAGFDTGLKFDWDANHLNVKIYGNAAVVAGYHVGTITLPNGDVSQGTRRFSEVWIKENGNWKQVHRHASQLEPVPRATITP